MNWLASPGSLKKEMPSTRWIVALPVPVTKLAERLPVSAKLIRADPKSIELTAAMVRPGFVVPKDELKVAPWSSSTTSEALIRKSVRAAISPTVAVPLPRSMLSEPSEKIFWLRPTVKFSPRMRVLPRFPKRMVAAPVAPSRGS